MQLKLFERPVREKTADEIRRPWLWISDWEPAVGDMCRMGAVILEHYGYVYGDPVRILNMSGDDVTVIVSSRIADFWKNGSIYECKVSDLCPIL